MIEVQQVGTMDRKDHGYPQQFAQDFAGETRQVTVGVNQVVRCGAMLVPNRPDDIQGPGQAA